jgi:signal transduction histidine kinase
VAALGVASALGGMAFWWGGTRSGGDWAWSLCLALVYGPAGVLLAGRAPRLGVVLTAMGACAGFAVLVSEHADATAAGLVGGPGALTVWLSGWTWVPAYVLLFAVVPHLLPDGRVLPGRAGWGYRLGLGAVALSTASWALCPYDELDEASRAATTLGVTNPVGVPGMAVGIAVCLALTLVGAAAGLLTLVLRWRRDPDHHALAWALAGFTLTAGLLIGGLGSGGHWALLAAAVVPLPGALVLGAATRTAALDAELRLTQARLAIAREEERRRLRHDLHDSLGPALAGVALQLETLPADITAAPGRAVETAERLTARVRDAVEDVRRLLDGLGPDGSLGLAEGLRQQVAVFDTPDRSTTLDMDPAAVADLPAALEVVALRVVGEALTNAARHAHADRCEVSVARRNGHLVVAVRDNGIGVGTAGPSRRTTGPGLGAGVGLLSMRAVAEEIGGRCTITSLGEGGTEVRVELPLGRP